MRPLKLARGDKALSSSCVAGERSVLVQVAVLGEGARGPDAWCLFDREIAAFQAADGAVRLLLDVGSETEAALDALEEFWGFGC